MLLETLLFVMMCDLVVLDTNSKRVSPTDNLILNLQLADFYISFSPVVGDEQSYTWRR